MTMTVKLPAPLERSLRQRVAALGRPASELIREALQAYLDATPPRRASPYALGEDLFGKHRGPPDLADTRKDALTRLWADKHKRRSTKARLG
jgi:Arc/MetJ-type ribon-helix-helix transcriptional regulator